jgi:hypothetical protein
MSTVTKIKGEIVNPNFPVLTDRGLKSFYLGKYINALSELGFTLSETQESAVDSFLNTLMNNDVLQFVKCFYPFIGTTTNPSAAKVPIIGEKTMDFPDNFNGFIFDGNDIKGYSKLPIISTFKVSDVAERNNLLGVAITINKNSSESSSTFIDRLMSFDSTALQVRYQKQSGSEGRLCTYQMLDGGRKDALFANTPSTFNTDAAGTYIAASIYGYNPSYYNRWVKMVGGSVNQASGTSLHYPNLSSSDMQQSMIETTAFNYVNYVSTFMAFKGNPNNIQISVIMDALESFITATGKL